MEVSYYEVFCSQQQLQSEEKNLRHKVLKVVDTLTDTPQQDQVDGIAAAAESNFDKPAVRLMIKGGYQRKKRWTFLCCCCCRD